MTAQIRRRIRGGLLLGGLLVLAGLLAVWGISEWVKASVKERILSPEQAAGLQVDCILVLGAGVRPDGQPSPLLQDRLDRGIELYRLGASERLLMSGDHGRKDYDEVGTMKQYAMGEGVPAEAIFLDHAGFSTYESIYRARDIFQVDTMLIVTQEYHLYRALYLAERLGVEAYGVAANGRTSGQWGRDLREVLARCKDVLYGLFQPPPRFLGEVIPIHGDASQTDG